MTEKCYNKSMNYSLISIRPLANVQLVKPPFRL